MRTVKHPKYGSIREFTEAELNHGPAERACVTCGKIFDVSAITGRAPEVGSVYCCNDCLALRFDNDGCITEVELSQAELLIVAMAVRKFIHDNAENHRIFRKITLNRARFLLSMIEGDYILAEKETNPLVLACTESAE